MSSARGTGLSGMPAVTPSLWFDDYREETAQFYTAVFPNSSIEKLHRYADARQATCAAGRRDGLPRRGHPRSHR